MKPSDPKDEECYLPTIACGDGFCCWTPELETWEEFVAAKAAEDAAKDAQYWEGKYTSLVLAENQRIRDEDIAARALLSDAHPVGDELAEKKIIGSYGYGRMHSYDGSKFWSGWAVGITVAIAVAYHWAAPIVPGRFEFLILAGLGLCGYEFLRRILYQ